jgi:hypothetical protein
MLKITNNKMTENKGAKIIDDIFMFSKALETAAIELKKLIPGSEEHIKLSNTIRAMRVDLMILRNKHCLDVNSLANSSHPQ